MQLFGVTGGIGSGKSTVCKLLQQQGIHIIAADPLAKDLTRTSPEIRTALIAEFGPAIYLPDGEPNKDKLRELVFSSPETRDRINSIIHPVVLTWIENEANRLHADEDKELIGVEAALIFESGMQRMLDAVVVVHAPLDKRRQWLQQRDNIDAETVSQRMAAQMPVDEKLRRADYVVHNHGSILDLQQEVDKLATWLRQELGKQS